MHQVIFPLATLLGGTGLLILGVGLLFSVLGLRAGLEHFSASVTGLVMSAYFAGFVVGTFQCPKLIRRVGHIRAFAAMASVASTMPILHALWVEPFYWAGLRFVTGICLVGLYLVLESWLHALAPSNERGKVFSVYLAVNGLALALGQWLLLVGDRLGFVPFAMVSVLLSFALVPITLTPVREPVPVDALHFSLRELYRISPMGVAGATVSGALNGALYGLGAVFMQRLGQSDAMVASFMACTILGGALCQWPIGHLSDRMDRRVVLAGICAGSAILATLAYVVAAYWPLGLLPMGAALGGLIFSVYGVSVAHVNDLIEPDRVLEVTGGLLLLHGIGAIVGPTVAGALMHAVGPGSLMLYFAITTVGMASYTVHRMHYAPPVPAQAKTGFVPAGAASPAALQLDPRAPVQESGAAPDHDVGQTTAQHHSNPSL